MTTTLPETLTYGKVVGRFIQAVGDSVDLDFLPNATPIVGNVTLTPVNPLTKEINTVPPTTVVRSAITCSLNTQGLLRSPAGDVGVWLVAGVYKVTYSTQGTAIPSHDILVTEEHTNENPLDLTIALPPGGPVLSPSQFAELSARIDAVEGGGPLSPPTALQITLDAADFFPDPLVIPSNATLVTVATITAPISVTIDAADDGVGFILHLAGGANNVTFTNAYPEGTFEDEVWATVVRASGAWRVFATDSGALANLSDVSLWGGQQDGDVLQWNESTQRWVAGTVPHPTTMRLSHLTDVDDGVDSADAGLALVLQENGSWAAGNLPSGGGGGGLPLAGVDVPWPVPAGLYATDSPSDGFMVVGETWLDEDDLPRALAVKLNRQELKWHLLDMTDGTELSLEESGHPARTLDDNGLRFKYKDEGVVFHTDASCYGYASSSREGDVEEGVEIGPTSITHYYNDATSNAVDTYLHSGAPLLQRSPDGTIWEGTIDNSGVLTWAPQA